MQYVFLINQKVLYALGLQTKLDIVDVALFNAIYQWFNNPKLHVRLNDEEYIEIRHSLVSKECPILGINHRDTFRKRLLKLVDVGLLERYANNQTENRSLYKRGVYFNCFDSDTDVPTRNGSLPTEIDMGADSNRQVVQTEIGTNILLNNQITKNNIEGITCHSSSCDDARQSSSSCYSWLMDYWNDNTKGAFKPITSIQGKRLDSVRARIKEYGAEQFKNAIIRATNSDFLKGAGRNGFIMTFDWLIKPNNFPKVLEGNYDNNLTTPNYGIRNTSSKFTDPRDVAAAVAAGINSAITEEQMSGTYRTQY